MRRSVRLAVAALVAAAAGGAAAAVPSGVFSPANAVRSGHSADPGMQAGPQSTGTFATGPRQVPGVPGARQVGGSKLAGTGTVVDEPAGAARLPKVPASAWVIANAGNGKVLAAKDPHGQFGPASTLKVLTAVALLPVVKPDANVVASKLATSQQPTSAGLVTGRSYRAADLFRAMLMISANDAAVALTQATGSETKGMAIINAEARRLQAYDVVAKLPNGLPAAGQVTSAYDEALIARQALKTPRFLTYDQTLTSRLQVKPGHWETLVNQNDLLTKYRGGIGGKIGWTRSSGATYVGIARRGGVTLIVTVLHCKSLQEVKAGEKLLNWGFANNGKVTAVGTLVPPLNGPGSG